MGATGEGDAAPQQAVSTRIYQALLLPSLRDGRVWRRGGAAGSGENSRIQVLDDVEAPAAVASGPDRELFHPFPKPAQLSSAGWPSHRRALAPRGHDHATGENGTASHEASAGIGCGAGGGGSGGEPSGRKSSPRTADLQQRREGC